MTTNTNAPPDPAEIAALKAGLDEAKKQGSSRMCAMKPTGTNKLIRTNIWLTPAEWGLRNLMSHVMTLHLGRPVGQALIVRLALRVLSAECQKSLRDPIVAARLKAELMAVRENR